MQARETAHRRPRYGEPSVQADGVGSFGRPRTWAPATPVACKGPEPPREGGRDKPGTHAAAILARVCGGGRQGWRLPNCKGAVPTDSANCSCAPSLLVGVWGAAARSGGDVCRAIGGAEALKNSVLLPLAFPRSTPILMRSSRGCSGRGRSILGTVSLLRSIVWPCQPPPLWVRLHVRGYVLSRPGKR